MKRRTLIIIACLMIAQGVAALAFILVEAQRDKTKLSTAPPRETSARVESYVVTMRDGRSRDLVSDRPVLAHFWGTWCPPCIDELPLVLALGDDLPFDVVTVALDDDWGAVDEFIEQATSPRIARADRLSAEVQFELSSLPQTVLIAPDGRLLLRVNGARDWTDPAFLNEWTHAVPDR